MIGISQIKRKLYTGLAIGGGIGIIGIGITLWWSLATIKSYESGTNKGYNAKHTAMVSVLNKNVIQGEIITSDMIQQQRVNKNTIPTNTLTGSLAVGQTAKYNIAANTPLISEMFTTNIMSQDTRTQELNTVLMPSDLVVGDYVDVRIMYANATDYIVLAQKQVLKIEAQTIWLNLTEDERLLFNSSMVDSFLNKGSKLYATKYTDPNAQVKTIDLSQIVVSNNPNNTTGTENGVTNPTKQTTEQIVRGYLSDAIKNELPNLQQTEDSAKVIDSVMSLLIKYNGFVSTITKTIANYQPNSYVQDQMKANSLIVQQAKDKLSMDVRNKIENDIKSYESSNEDKLNNVVSGAENSINDQKELRDSLLNPAQY